MVEIDPTPRPPSEELVLRIKIDKKIDDLYDLRDVLEGLTDISLLEADFNPISQAAENYRSYVPNDSNDQRIRYPGPRLVSFSVKSPALITIVTDPAWLSLFVSLFFGFRAEIRIGIEQFVKSIRGLGASERKEIIARAKYNVGRRPGYAVSSHEVVRLKLVGTNGNIEKIKISVVKKRKRKK
jgi:hypothetical protein